MRLLFTLIYITCVGFVFSQNNRVSDLKLQLKTVKNDTARIKIYSELAELIIDEEEWVPYNDKVFDLAEKNIKSSKGNLRDFYLHYKADAIANRGYYYSDHGDLNRALEYYFNSLEIFDEINLEIEKAPVLGNIGIILTQQGDCDEALDYLNRAIEYKLKYEPENTAVNYINIGSAYECLLRPADALKAYEKALSAGESVEDYESMATATNNIGAYYNDKKDFKKAISYLKKAVDLYNKAGSKSGAAWAYANLGDNYLELNKVDSARYYNLIAKKLSNDINHPRLTANVSENLAAMYERLGDWKNAFQEYKIYIKMEDSLRNITVQKNALRQKLEYDHKLDTMAINMRTESERMRTESERKQSEQARNYSLIVLVLVIIFALILYRRLGVTRKQKNTIEEQNKEILDSINYAKRLQNAILPGQAEISRNFSDAFVLYLPKDIVAGDFYWMHKKNDLVFIAAADCTGHGVPGAMVSVVCANALERAAFEFGIEDTGKLLDKTRELVIDTYEKSSEDVKDGMDISLCSVNLKTGECKFTGAHNPLWVKKKNGTEIKIYKGDRQPVGKAEHARPFSSHLIQLERGDWVYMFSDGFIDQFGGPEGKKFRSAQFKSLLSNNSEVSGDKQKEVLLSEFNQWKSGQEQLDDVCVVGWQF